MASTELTLEQKRSLNLCAHDVVGKEILGFFTERGRQEVDANNSEWKQMLEIRGNRASRLIDEFILQGIFKKNGNRIAITLQALEYAKGILNRRTA